MHINRSTSSYIGDDLEAKRNSIISRNRNSTISQPNSPNLSADDLAGTSPGYELKEERTNSLFYVEKKEVKVSNWAQDTVED